MESKHSILVILLVLLGIVNGTKVDDTMKFDAEWKKSSQAVNLQFSYLSGVYSFTLSYPEVVAPNILSSVYLLQDSSFVEAFNPTSKTANGVTTYNLNINVEDFDSAKYTCGRTEQDPVTNVEKKTCRGVLFFVHNEDLGADNSRANLFRVGYGANDQARALMRWDFQIITIFDLRTQTTLRTFVKTKVKVMECTTCTVSQTFSVTPKFCLNETDCSATSQARNPEVAYTFSDDAFIHFAVTPSTRTFEVLEFYAAQPRDAGGVEQTLPVTYVKKIRQSTGNLVVSVPMGFLASDVGEALSLRFVLRLAASGRFLSSSFNNERELQGNVEVVLATTPTLRVVKDTSSKGITVVGGVSEEDQAKLKKSSRGG